MVCTIDILTDRTSQIILDYAQGVLFSNVELNDGMHHTAQQMPVTALDSLLHMARTHGMRESWR